MKFLLILFLFIDITAKAIKVEDFIPVHQIIQINQYRLQNGFLLSYYVVSEELFNNLWNTTDYRTPITLYYPATNIGEVIVIKTSNTIYQNNNNNSQPKKDDVK